MLVLQAAPIDAASLEESPARGRQQRPGTPRNTPAHASGKMKVAEDSDIVDLTAEGDGLFKVIL